MCERDKHTSLLCNEINYSRKICFDTSLLWVYGFLGRAKSCLRITRTGAYPRVEHLKGASLEQAPALLANIRLN